MALHLQTFKTRSLTAVVFVLVMLTGLLWNGWSFFILFTIIHFGCWSEFLSIVKKIFPDGYLSQSLFGLVYITIPILMIMDLGFSGNIFTKDHVNETTSTFQYSAVIPCGIIFSIWINDTMAYIVGSMIGKTPFSKISPKKTWEGTIGGMVLCIVVMGILGYLVSPARIIAVKHWIAIACLCAIFGTAGDLLESKLKRMAGVKDSGSIMPGHGGFLDRFDSLLISVLFVWMYLKLFV